MYLIRGFRLRVKKKKKFNSVKFPVKKSLGKREWGKEILLALIPKLLSLKMLTIKKGSKGGLQYHNKKNECGYILSGKLKLIFQNKNGKLIKKVLKKGDVFHIPPKAIHQEEAITECKIIEASSSHFNDRVRVEKMFNIKEIRGLKSTKVRDIIHL